MGLSFSRPRRRPDHPWRASTSTPAQTARRADPRPSRTALAVRRRVRDPLRACQCRQDTHIAQAGHVGAATRRPVLPHTAADDEQTAEDSSPHKCGPDTRYDCAHPGEVTRSNSPVTLSDHEVVVGRGPPDTLRISRTWALADVTPTAQHTYIPVVQLSRIRTLRTDAWAGAGKPTGCVGREGWWTHVPDLAYRRG